MIHPMAQCIETISALNEKEAKKIKTLFWNSTSLTPAFEKWFKKASPSFLYHPFHRLLTRRRHREQIRILSVFSISPEVDLFVMKTVQKVMNRFRCNNNCSGSHG